VEIKVPAAYDASDPFAFMGASGTGQTTFSTGASSDTPVMFYVDKTLQAVEYGDPADIVEIYRSMNMARITPDGMSPENSSAFICTLKREGVMRVFVPFLLSESGKVLVYVPERQPENPDELAGITRDAVEFIEAVGFIMDAVSLEGNSQTRTKIIKNVPVLSRIHKEAGKSEGTV
jgi:hypothetical protein